jgi:hypothetical protein
LKLEKRAGETRTEFARRVMAEAKRLGDSSVQDDHAGRVNSETRRKKPLPSGRRFWIGYGSRALIFVRPLLLALAPLLLGIAILAVLWLTFYGPLPH